MYTQARRPAAALRCRQGIIQLWRRKVAALLALALLLAPQTAHAQEDTALRQIVQDAATYVAQRALTANARGHAAQTDETDAERSSSDSQSPTPPPGVVTRPQDDIEEPAEDPAEGSADGSEPAQASAAGADWFNYANAGVTVTVPAAWETISPDAETIFATSAPSSEFAVVMVDIGADIPSFIALTLFRVAGGDMLQEWIPDAEMKGVASAFTAQGLPMVRLDFNAEIDGEPATGAFFVISAGSQAYVLLVAGTVDEFDRYAEEAEEVVDSLAFDPSLITYVQADAQADGEPLVYTDDEGLISVSLPDGWFAADTGDEQLPVILMDPTISYVMMLSTDTTLDTSFDASRRELFDTEDGTPDPAVLDEIAARLADLLGERGDSLIFDPDLTTTYPRAGGVIIRMVGEGDFSAGTMAPVALYLDLRTAGGALVILVGEIDPALADEESLFDVVTSINTPESSTP